MCCSVCSYGFLLPPAQIVPTGKTVLAFFASTLSVLIIAGVSPGEEILAGIQAMALCMLGQ